MRVFSKLEVESFHNWMLVHLRRFLPSQCLAVGEPRLPNLIQSGIEHAASYGITTRRDVCKFIDLMVVFGRDFDTRLPWAGPILTRGSPQGERMQVLFATAVRHLRNS